MAYVKLLCVRSSTFAGWYFLRPHNLYRMCSSPVTSSHISICMNTIICDNNVITSSQHAVTAAAMLISRYSLYMLWVPLLESYLNQIPTFLIFNGVLSYTWIRGWSMATSWDYSTWLHDTISPADFFNFFSLLVKYQNRDLAHTSSGANIFIRYRGGLRCVSEGRRLPITLYSFNYHK